MDWCQDIVEVAPKDKWWRQKVGIQKGEGVAVDVTGTKPYIHN